MTARKQRALEGTEIGERIRALRQALGLTQEQLAARFRGVLSYCEPLGK